MKFRKYLSFLEDFVKNYKCTLHPFYLYMIILWIVSKVVQNILNQNQTVWEWTWEAFLNVFGDDSFQLYVNGSLILESVVLITIMGFFTFMDFTLSPKALRKYKIQRSTNEPVKRKKFLKAILLTIFNGAFVGFPYIILAHKFAVYRIVPNVHVLPSFHVNLIESYLCFIIYEIVFYSIHRILHTKFFYKNFHKIHHEWVSTSSVAALYCHPLEFLFGNLFPATAGVFLMRSHIATIYTWLFILFCTTAGDHSGYHLPFVHSSEFHDYHHRSFTSNFGENGWLDRLIGTDASFKETIHDVRHRNLFTLESAQERFPDEYENKKEK